MIGKTYQPSGKIFTHLIPFLQVVHQAVNRVTLDAGCVNFTVLITVTESLQTAQLPGFRTGTMCNHRGNGASAPVSFVRTLRSAASISPYVKGAILQNDQGFQYQSAAYHSLVSQYGIIPSMSRKGNCLDNAPTKKIFTSEGRIVAVNPPPRFTRGTSNRGGLHSLL